MPPSGKLDLPVTREGPQLALRRAPRSLGLVASASVPLSAQLLLGEALLGQTTVGVPRQGSSNYIWVPWSQDDDNLWEFNNPNEFTFPTPSEWAWDWRNKVGYITYVQYLLDWGRDRSPLHENSSGAAPGSLPKTPLSYDSDLCPLHKEATPGGTFSFPPREQPMHAIRRALIAALQQLKQLNSGLQPSSGDKVAVVTFDGLDSHHAPEVAVSLTADFDAAMLACTTLQAASDIGNTTATEAGLKTARDHLKDVTEGGQGRGYADKAIILITDGVPNATQSGATTIQNYIASNPLAEWYGADFTWYNAPLMQVHQAQSDNIRVFAVGMGLGADYDFLDRLARLGQTDHMGQSPRVSGNPAEYERLLVDVIAEIVRNPGTRLVK
jgi:hypothetical protein